MAQSPQQHSPGVFSRIGSWLLWGWGSPQPSGDVPSPETQEETPDEDNSETESPSVPTAVKVTDQSPIPAERSPTLTRNAKHLISISAGGEGSGESSRGHRSQVYLEETSEDSDSDIYNIRRYKSRTEPDVTFSPQLTFDLADRRESDTMGRRKSGKRRRSSHGDGGGAKMKSPTTSQPSSPATTSLARSPETAWAESAFEAAPKTVPECLRGEPPNSPGAARYESTVQSEWTERHLSDTSELLSSPESTDPDMDEETVVRLTETPESKRRSLKVSHSEKFFTKKVLVTSKPHTEEQHESLKGAGDTVDSELVKADKGARCSENIGTVKMKPKVGRIADKISLFENQASSSTNPRCLGGSPARNVTGHFRQFTEPAGTRSGTAPQKQLIKGAQNFTVGRKGGEKFSVQSGSSGVSGRTLNGGHLKTEKSAVKTDTSREKPEIKSKPSLNTDQTDSNSHNATVSTLFESTRVENKAMERANCYPSTVSSPSETQQVKSPTRTGSRSKKRRSKDTVQPLSPTSKNKQEIDLDKQEVKDINSYSMPSKPPKDAKTTEKYLKINSDKVTISHFPNEKPEELMRADTDTKMLTFPQTDAKEIKSEETENKSSCFKPKTVTSTSETQASPPSGSTENNSKTEEQTQPKHSETQEQKTNSNKSPAVQQSSERHRRESLKNRDMTVNTLFAEPAKPDPSVTDEEKPLSPEDLKEAHSKYPRKPANNSSRIDVMRNRESETDIKVIPEKDTARARRTTECVPKSEEEQELKPNHKSDEKDKNNVTKTLDQNTELIKNNNDRVTCTPVKQNREREMSKQSEPKETSAGRHDVIKTSQRKKTETTKKDTSTPPPASSEEKTTPPPASSQEKPTPPPASSEEKPTPPPASSEEKTTPPPASSQEKPTPPPASSEEKTTAPPALSKEKPTPPPASSEEKTTPPPALSEEKTTPSPASLEEKTTPPPASSELKTTPPPASSEEKPTPPPASSEEKTTPPPALSEEKSTPSPASSEEKTTPPPASSELKTTPPPASSEEKTTPPPASSELKTTPPPASSELKTTPLPASSKEKTTPPPASSEEKTTPPPASSKEKPTPSPASSKEKPTPSPASSELKTTHPPPSSELKTTLPPASSELKTTPPPASSEEKTTPPPASSEEKTTPPPASSEEKTTPLPASSELKTTPLPASSKEKPTPSPASSKEKPPPSPASSKEKPTPSPASSELKTTHPPPSSELKTTLPPASLELKTTPPPASSEEKTTPPPASSEEKTTPPPASSEEKTTPLPASSELKTTPLPASSKEKPTPSPASSKEKPPPASSKLKPTPPPASSALKTTPPPASSEEKTTPPPASSELKTTPPPASSEEKTTPPPASNKKKVTSPPASSNEKATPLLASASDKSQTSISLMKPQSSDLATRRKEFIRKPLILPQITSAPGHVSLNRDSPSSWLDVERPVRRKQSIPDPKPKLNSSASETNLLEASREFDPHDFISNVKRLAMPFTLPQRKHKQNRLQAPPFAMPSIREDRNEKPFDLEEFQVGLRRRREFMLDLIPTKSQNSEMKEKDDKPKRVNPERESILTRSVLFKRAKIEQQEEKNEEEKESDESKTEPVPVRSRLERCSILSGLRNPTKTRRKELLSPTDVLLSPTDAPSSPSQPRPTLDSPKQDISCTQTDDQVHLKPDEPKITPDLKPPVADLQPPPPSCQQIAHGPVMTPDPKTTPADSTVATVTEADAPPPLPSFDNIKLPGYLEKFLTKEPETVQTSDGTDSTVSSESISEPAVVDLNKTVDVQTTNNIPVIPPANIPAACGFHRRPGKMVIYQQHQFNGQSFEFYRDETDATHLQLSSVISVKVIRGCWILFEKAGFEGRCIALEEEDIVELPNEWAEEAGQTSVPFVIGSVRLAVRDYTPPRIELFSELKGRGRCSEYVDDTAEVCAFGLPQNTGSIKVHSGLWMVYSDPGFQGLLAVLEAGEYPCPESWGFPVPAVGSLKALRMGGLKVQNPNAVKAVLYEKAGLQGRCVEVQTDVFSFTQTDRESDGHGLSSVSSLKILRGLWVGYDQEGFDGQQYVLEEGEYLDWRDWAGTGQNLLSLRPVLTDFSSPHMKMFSDLDFSDRGMNIDLLEPLENTAITDYSPQTRSVNVLSGAWVVFEEAGFSGQHYVIERGLYSCPEDWGSSSSQILSVIPVILDNQSSSHFKIQLFSEPDFCGSSILLEDSLPTMPQGFIMSSCRVITGSWLAFRCEGLSGSQCVLEEGDYQDLRMMGFTQPNTSVLSLQPAGLEFSLPSIVLFERSGFRGRRTVLKSSSVNLQLTESCTRVSSILVEGGIWILYEANNFRGSQFLLKPGEVPDWPKLSTWTRIGSLRPLIQKQVHFRLRNKEAGLLMSVVGSLGDLMRIQATEETGGVDQIWMYQDGHLQCKLLASCYVDVSSGVLMASSRAVLSSDPDKPTQLWNITSDGLIRNNAALNLVLEVKGGQQFDKTQIILNEFHPNKLNQRWTLELL